MGKFRKQGRYGLVAKALQAWDSVGRVPHKSEVVGDTLRAKSATLPEPVRETIVGAWKTQWGTVRLRADGSGSYPHERSTLVGEISDDGRRWSGQWFHHGTNTRSGDAVFEMTSDGRLEGRYWSAGKRKAGAPGNAWPGVRIDLQPK